MIILSFLPTCVSACSMYKITENGKTIVGNNEDWFNPNNQFWFEPAEITKFGVMYMGQLDNFAQGAMNEKGLMFDGFSVPFLAINHTEGKTKIPIGQAIKHIMQSMHTVDEVKVFLETINLSTLTNSMLVFVDQTGAYLVVEGDELFIGHESEKAFSNFYYSQTKSLDQVNVAHFQRGQKFLQSSKSQSTLQYCAQAMSHFAQNSLTSATQYSTIYDLNALKVRVYLFHDFTQFVEIDLKEQLEKGHHKTMIADLFPKESIGYQHYLKYNDPENPTLYIEEITGASHKTEQELYGLEFADDLNQIGYDWMKSRKNPRAAIKILEYGTRLMPNNADLYDSLGEAYLMNNDCSNSIKNYKKSLSINPENVNALEKMKLCTESQDIP